ncbi:MAG: hypothetical protein AMR96_03040 [Candidatus Adiutrix intracellularis]|jgi:hypothetical protein|nr:MAG: hypothetical protein AMR96_03040 [Candidatus Adiutrix intracellularis]MDR2826709.1 hypothetical protein [Candidatus Adiutrix intracellularis]
MKTFIFILFLTAGLSGLLVPAAAQDEQDLVYERLAQIMVKEQPLADEDVRIYIENAESIYRLRFEPEKLNETIKSINSWTENRFAYVTTKMAVGMSQLIRPEDPRNTSIPEFAKPSPPEIAVIRRAQDELTRTMERLQAKYYGSPTT